MKDKHPKIYPLEKYPVQISKQAPSPTHLLNGSSDQTIYGLLGTSLEYLPLVIFDQDADLRYTKVYNPRHGITIDQVLGKTDELLLSPQDATRLTALKRQVLTTGVGIREQIPLTIGGETFYYDLLIDPLFNDEGGVIGITGIALDVTERGRAEQALSESEERYRRLVEQSPQMIAVHREGIFLYINSAGARLLGRASPAEVIGQPVLRFVYPDCRDYVARRLAKSYMDNAAYQWGEERFVRVDGVVFNLEMSAAPIIYQGKLASQLVALDITERKQVKQSFQEYVEGLKIINALEQEILTAQSPDEIIQATLNHLQNPIPYQQAVFLVFGPKTERLVEASAWKKSADQRWLNEELTLEGPHPTDNEDPKPGALSQGWIGLIEDEYFPKAIPTNQAGTCLALPLLVEDQLIGKFILSADNTVAFTTTHVEISQKVVPSLAVAIQNARLLRQGIEAHKRLKRLSKRLLEIQEAVQRQIGRELHDEIDQALTGLSLLLEMSLRATHDHNPHDHNEIETYLKEAQTITEELLERVEALSLDLRPTMLDDLGLFPTLLWHLDRYTGRTGVKVNFVQLGLKDQRFAPKIETAVYRIIQEALTNVARHAGVREAAVRVWVDETQLFIQIEDNGCGFDVDQALGQGDAAGLSGMRERADLLGGHLSIESRQAVGTVIQAELPLILYGDAL